MSTPAERYLEAVHKGLADLPEEDIEEVLQDLAAHIAELGDIDPVAALGSPETFIAEFRVSAGLDGTSKRPGRIRRWVHARRNQLERARNRTAVILEPLIEPIAQRRDELRTVWIWSRGALALTAFSWLTQEVYGTQRIFGTASGLSTASAYVAVTVASVWLAGESRKWWRRADAMVSLAAVGLLLLAIASPRYLPYPGNNAYPETDPSMPVLLIGPNGPIQNLYAYDITGNPVQVLLYDEYGNPILTLPDFAYGQAEDIAQTGEPFIWEGYEIRFATDAYGRPIGNLYPLDRYEWTDTGARSAPQPPPVVGIPTIPAETGQDVAPTADGVTASTAPESTATTTPAYDQSRVGTQRR
jgi:hypothetical protein